MPDFIVNGVVAQRDGQPYIQLANADRMIGQFTMAQASSIAMDILVMCSRTEADAMLWHFFQENNFPNDAATRLMQMFRDFRSKLDAEKVERSESDGHDGG